ncbi:hypothetical protein ACWDOP_02675 [Nocardia sp. NPDC003693]
MSSTKFVGIDGLGFWAVDDALDVWLAYLVGQIEPESLADDPWFGGVHDQWRRAAALDDHGVTMVIDNERQRDLIRACARAARSAAVDGGDIGPDRLRQWLILDGTAVSDGFARHPEGVVLTRILEVADGFIALLEGRLEPAPDGSRWHLGTGEGMRTIAHQ